MPITLRPITRDNLRAVVRLNVSPEQEDFVAPNAFSIAQVYVEPTWEPLAIYADETPVGFTLLGRDEESGVDWIIRFMIAAEQQGKGYGRAALQAIIAHLRAKPTCTDIGLSYVPGNSLAESLYQKVGFVATGEVEDDEIIMRLQK
jgi:diamine N-acetyltransferase